MRMNVFPAWVYCTACAQCLSPLEEEVISDSLELILQMVMNHQMATGYQTQVRATNVLKPFFFYLFCWIWRII